MKTTLLFCLAAYTVAAPSNQKVTIQGGKEIDITKRPYNVAVNMDGILMGGGVLLNRQWVMAEALTFFGYQRTEFNIRVGSSSGLTGGTVHNISKIIYHPKFRCCNWPYRFVLVKLTEPITVTKSSKPIEISDHLPKEDQDTIATGYGLIAPATNGLLRETIFPFMSHQTCQEKLHFSNSTLPEHLFCSSKPDTGLCRYDWGNPLIYKDKLIGVFISTTDMSCSTKTSPAIFADATKFKEWIKSIIEK